MSTLALVHPSDLVAGEVRESLNRRRDLWEDLLLFSSLEGEIGGLSEVRGTATIVQQLEKNSLKGVDVAFFGASIGANRPLLADLPPQTAAIVLSPDAGLEDGLPIVAGVNLAQANRDRPMLSPHPATVALAHLIHPLLEFTPRLAAATVLQPASTRGKAGLDEMFEQTRSILSFADTPPRDVFHYQAVFNIVSAPTPAGRLEDQLRIVLGKQLTATALSIHLLQAGVFHCYSIALYLDLTDDPGLEAVRRALGEHPANELVSDPELLGPVDAAAREEVLIGSVDSLAGGRYRLWAVMDNLTCGGASNALQILEAISHQATH